MFQAVLLSFDFEQIVDPDTLAMCLGGAWCSDGPGTEIIYPVMKICI
jgi:hypothetical protein